MREEDGEGKVDALMHANASGSATSLHISM